MRAYLIDPYKETVTEVEHDDTLESIYRYIEADTFDVAYVAGRGGGVFVDDEGLFKRSLSAWVYLGYHSPLVGKGLMLGCDPEGNSIGPEPRLDSVQRHVIWFGADWHRAGEFATKYYRPVPE